MTPKPKLFDRNVDGIVLLDKPQGLSSNAALQQVRRLFRARKAGHAGSLDPMATGMLPVCLGEATKVCAFLLDAGKSYRFTARLGQRSDTGDAEGSVTEEAAIPALSVEQVNTVLNGYLGTQQQVPPMYSALKHQGQRLYDMARRGEVIERESRSITIHRLALLRLTRLEFEAEVSCSKGTYVRTLAEDLAQRLGTLAHLTALRRVVVEPFDSNRMLTLEQLVQMSESERSSCLMPLDSALEQLPKLALTAAQCIAITQGRELTLSHPHPADTVLRLYDPDLQFIGMGQIDSGLQLRPKRLLATSNPSV